MESIISTNIALRNVIESWDESLLIFLNISKNNDSSSFAVSCNFLMILTSFEDKEEEEMLSGEFAEVDEGRAAAVATAAGGR